MRTRQKPLVIALALSAALSATWAGAQDLQLKGNVGQQAEFRALSDDLGAALSYKAKTPTEPLGITGFDVGISVSSTKLANADRYGAALDNNTNLLLPSVSAQKGLPLGFDIGATYAAANGIKFVGGELRYALLEGGALVPAVGLRGSMTRLSGVDELGLSTRGLDLSVSKGFAFATPYAGIGRVWVNSTPRISGVALENETFWLSKYYLGIGLNMMLMNLNIEADRTGDATSYSAKLGIRF